MAATMTWYDHTWKLVTTGGLDLDGAELRLRLVTSGYVFSATHTQWDNGANDATDPSFSELPTAGNYTAGGKILTNPAVTSSAIDYDDATWNNLTATFRHAICVAIGTFGGVVNPLVFRLLPNSDNTDYISNGSNFAVVWHPTDKLVYRPS